MTENKAIVPDEIISPDCNIDRTHKNIPIETIIEYRNRELSVLVYYSTRSGYSVAKVLRVWISSK